MASGVPTVCARASGSVSLIEEAKTGLLGPPTVDGLTGPLRTLALNSDTRRTYGAAARQVADGFDWDEILGGLVENYRAAIAAYARSALE
ncbi:MAG: glycosyltransferase family 1 protein, partial [Pseudomonadota bacterium]